MYAMVKARLLRSERDVPLGCLPTEGDYPTSYLSTYCACVQRLYISSSSEAYDAKYCKRQPGTEVINRLLMLQCWCMRKDCADQTQLMGRSRTATAGWNQRRTNTANHSQEGEVEEVE